MSVTFRLTRDKESAETKEFSFDDESLSIGRDLASSLHLKSTLVSKHHAEIKRDDVAYAIKDLGSTNGTFVNNKKISAHTPLPVHLGDKIRIGDYHLEVIHLSLVSQEVNVKPVADQPVPSQVPTPDFKSAEAKDVEVKDARPSEDHPVPDHRIALLQGQVEQLVSECNLLKEENQRLESIAGNARNVSELVPHSQVPLHAQPHIVEALRIFLKTIVRLGRSRRTFYNDFIGMTYIRSGPSLLDNLENEGVSFLVAESLKDEEAEHRRTLLFEELDEAALHSLALLNGYKKGIETGTHKLLDRLRFDLVIEELNNATLQLGSVAIPYRFLPIIRELRAIQLVRQRLKELLAEDRGVLEKRFYREGFIRGYQTFVRDAKNQDVRDK